MRELPELARKVATREAREAGPEVRAVLVAGSFARGDALPGSDLDLYLILADGEPKRFVAYEEAGLLVERTGWDEAEARRRIAVNSMAWATFGEAFPLRDDGVLAGFRGAAEAAAHAWRPDPAEVAACAHWLRSAAGKVEAALGAGDDARAAFAAATSTYELARGLFFANGRPAPAAGAVWRALQTLAERPDDAALDALLLAPGVGDRCAAFAAAARWTLARLTPREEAGTLS